MVLVDVAPDGLFGASVLELRSAVGVFGDPESDGNNAPDSAVISCLKMHVAALRQWFCIGLLFLFGGQLLIVIKILTETP